MSHVFTQLRDHTVISKLKIYICIFYKRQLYLVLRVRERSGGAVCKGSLCVCFQSQRWGISSTACFGAALWNIYMEDFSTLDVTWFSVVWHDTFKNNSTITVTQHYTGELQCTFRPGIPWEICLLFLEYQREITFFVVVSDFLHSGSERNWVQWWLRNLVFYLDKDHYLTFK